MDKNLWIMVNGTHDVTIVPVPRTRNSLTCVSTNQWPEFERSSGDPFSATKFPPFSMAHPKFLLKLIGLMSCRSSVEPPPIILPPPVWSASPRLHSHGHSVSMVQRSSNPSANAHTMHLDRRNSLHSLDYADGARFCSLRGISLLNMLWNENLHENIIILELCGSLRSVVW